MRSKMMSRIRSRDTKPELILRQALWRRGLRYRVNFKTPAGRADLAFPARSVAVFVDGCFWHGCPEHYVKPRNDASFWKSKLQENVARDERQTYWLEHNGWCVLRFWEHEVYVDLARVVGVVCDAVGRRSVG